MSDVAGTPLPTTGSTTQTNTTSAGHSPTFTSATNGFQVTEEVDLNLATTATGPFCTKVTQPGAIEYYQGGTWWSHVFDYNAQTSSGNTHLAVTSYQILEIHSINYFVAGITQPNPFGANSPFVGLPYYRVMVECVVGGYQPNYNTGDVVTFMSTNYWNPGYLATAFRLNAPSNGSCWGYTDKPISGGNTASMSVAQSVSVSLPTTGSNTQTSAGTGGGIGFIDGGGGDGWNGCPGGTSGSSDDSNWNAVQATTHAPTFTGTSGVIPSGITGYPLPSSGSSSQSTCPNDGWLSFIDGGGGEGWMDCNGDGQDDGGGGGGGGNDSYWNQKVPNVHAPTYIETNHPGGFGIDRTYPGDPSNALPAGGHNWEIKYTVHQIQYATVNCASGAVTGQINYNSPDEYKMVYSSVSSQATAIRLIANPSRTTSTGCSAPTQGWTITSTVVPLTLEVTYTGSGAGTVSQILSPPSSTSWNNGTLGGVYQSGNLTDNWITIIHVKRDGVIQ